MIPVFANLLNSGSKIMTLNGQVVPKVFTYTPNVRSGIVGIMCVLRDEGITSLNKFGAKSALINGLLIQVTLNGVTTDIAIIKDNAELCSRFHFNQFGNGAILSVLGIATAEGFGNSSNIFIGYMEFNAPNFITLQPDDILTVTVRDDLSNISLLEMSVKAIVE